ncbi:MAG: protein kinase domain-containing protein [Gemmatimonadales bacterium]
MTDQLARLRDALGDRYDVEREIGHGGMAHVYLARDLRHGRLVALKVLRPELAAALGPDRFLREIQIEARLQHPHILPLFDSGSADGLLYYVMPYVEGETLRNRMSRETQLPLLDAVQIACEVADALGYAHSLDVVHRDIKPGNILLSGGHAVVADFGIARAISAAGGESTSEAGLAVGTPDYMSPEQASGYAHIDGRSDVYALGCVLYEMLAGEPPYSGPTPDAILARHRLETPRSLRVVRPNLPAEVQQAVETALAKLPADRFATAREFAQALNLGVRGTPPERVSKFRVPRGAILLAAALALAVIVSLTLRDRFGSASSGVGVVVLPFAEESAGGDTDGKAVTGSPAPHRLLAEAIEWLPGLHAIEGGQLLGASRDWRSMAVPALLLGAERLGGRYLVTGTVRSQGRDAWVSVDLYAIHDGERLLRDQAQAERGHLEGPANRLALQLVQTVAAREGLDSGARKAVFAATTSAAAMGHLLQGQARFWRDDNDGAAAAFREAVAVDADCGLAYHRLSIVEEWRHDFPAALAAVDAGLARRKRIGARWAQLLQAQRYYLLGAGDSAIAGFQEAVLDYRDDIDAWLGLGESLIHFGGLAGRQEAEAMPALDRVMALDSTFAPIQYHLFDLALYQGDERRATGYLRAMRADDRSRPPREAALTLRFGSPSARGEALGRLRTADRAVVAELVTILLHDGFDLPLADTVSGDLVGPEASAYDRRRGADYRLFALAGQGRWNDALATWRSAAGDQPWDAWLVQAWLAGYPAAEVATPMLVWARQTVKAAGVVLWTLPLWDERQQAVQALVHHATLEGDSAEVGGLLRLLRAAPDQPELDARMPAALRASLQARLALLAGDTSGAIGLLQRSVARIAEPFTTYFPLTAMAPQRFLLAQLFAARGDGRSARRWLDSFSSSSALADALYGPPARRLRSQLGPP